MNQYKTDEKDALLLNIWKQTAEEVLRVTKGVRSAIEWRSLSQSAQLLRAKDSEYNFTIFCKTIEDGLKKANEQIKKEPKRLTPSPPTPGQVIADKLLKGAFERLEEIERLSKAN